MLYSLWFEEPAAKKLSSVMVNISVFKFVFVIEAVFLKPCTLSKLVSLWVLLLKAKWSFYGIIIREFMYLWKTFLVSMQRNHMCLLKDILAGPGLLCNMNIKALILPMKLYTVVQLPKFFFNCWIQSFYFLKGKSMFFHMFLLSLHISKWKITK